MPGHRKASSSLLAAVCVGREWTEGSLRPRMQRRGLLCPKCHIFRRFPHPCPHLHKCFLSMLLWEKHPAGGCYGDPGTPWADGSLVSEAGEAGGHSEEGR